MAARRELVFLILQYLEEDKYMETVHRFEKESGFFFNMKYLEEIVTNGDWEEVENYLSGFTKVEDNRHSSKIFFEIRKQRYLEALDSHDNDKAVEILQKDLKAFSSINPEIFKEITMLLTLENFRENEQLSSYGDAKIGRAIMLAELKKVIEANPIFHDKLEFPNFKKSRLRTLINQSLNWQHHLCNNPRQNPDIKTLFWDHSCGPGACATSPAINPLMGSLPKPAAPPSASLPGWMANPYSAPHQTVSSGPIGLTVPNNTSSLLKRPRTPPNNLAMDYQTADSGHVSKRSRALGTSDEVNNRSLNVFPHTYPGHIHAHTPYSSEDLPKTVVVNLTLGSAAKSLEFHPLQRALLLVGTNIGDITIWEVGRRERLVSRNFKIWDLSVCSMALQASLANEYTASVNRVIWSPDGSHVGIAYSKHVVHIYSYHGGDDLRNHLEIDAHAGNVSDLAFTHLNKKLCIISCGEDKTTKVWDAVTGNKLYNFEGHEAPVYSVCEHIKDNVQFIFATAIDGKIKAWLYDNVGSRVDYHAPGHSCTRMVYSTDGTRLFSCGTNKEGESYIVEWNENEGTVKRTYNGLGKQTHGVVQFDTTKNQFLAAGDDFQIKYWDMDNVNLLNATDAEGGLLASPCLRFNKEGTMLAVSTSENGVKVLANADGIRILRAIENCAVDASRMASGTAMEGPIIGTSGASSSAHGTNNAVADRSLNGDGRSFANIKVRVAEELEKPKTWKLTEVNEPSLLRFIWLPDSLLVNRIVRLVYANSGASILALTSTGVHILWKWQKDEKNVLGKATTTVPPLLWQPASGIVMTNQVPETTLEDPIHCLAISKNDSYALSASGGKVSLYNMMNFKTMMTFIASPPAATFLAFHPQDNNIIAVGMDDSTIQIYNVRTDEVQNKLKGHQRRVTGLAFSNVLNVLVSAGADSQLCTWSIDGWRKQAAKFLQIPTGRVPTPNAQTRVQFHQDQIHMLAAHATQIAIYEAPKLECLKQWVPRELIGPLADATYSCDSQSIYASFEDGSVCILTASTLRIRYRISTPAYVKSSPSTKVYPAVVAAHPSDPNQFALGLTNGGVVVMEPPESEGTWGTMPPVENAGPNASSVVVRINSQGDSDSLVFAAGRV
ncbi:topless-related protein 4-like isoform X2 [Malus sylvestris]|uniref:topless-related protein 4-like isoform X2 n=1 Tax=Malus sylvestris TaxID=3752 RepID=UPI0021ACED75|nr:topless-related protein 4-like isoform X2 [Malus sylvestris]